MWGPYMHAERAIKSAVGVLAITFLWDELSNQHVVCTCLSLNATSQFHKQNTKCRSMNMLQPILIDNGHTAVIDNGQTAVIDNVTNSG